MNARWILLVALIAFMALEIQAQVYDDLYYTPNQKTQPVRSPQTKSSTQVKSSPKTVVVVQQTPTQQAPVQTPTQSVSTKTSEDHFDVDAYNRRGPSGASEQVEQTDTLSKEDYGYTQQMVKYDGAQIQIDVDDPNAKIIIIDSETWDELTQSSNYNYNNSYQEGYWDGWSSSSWYNPYPYWGGFYSSFYSPWRYGYWGASYYSPFYYPSYYSHHHYPSYYPSYYGGGSSWGYNSRSARSSSGDSRYNSSNSRSYRDGTSYSSSGTRSNSSRYSGSSSSGRSGNRSSGYSSGRSSRGESSPSSYSSGRSSSRSSSSTPSSYNSGSSSSRSDNSSSYSSGRSSSRSNNSSYSSGSSSSSSRSQGGSSRSGSRSGGSSRGGRR